MGQSVRLCDQGVRRGGCVEVRRRVALTSYATSQVYMGENPGAQSPTTDWARMDAYPENYLPSDQEGTSGAYSLS